MESGEELETEQEQEIRVRKDLRHLSATLNGAGLRIDIMFSRERGIRSVTPPFDTLPGNGGAVRERLRRVEAPPVE